MYMPTHSVFRDLAKTSMCTSTILFAYPAIQLKHIYTSCNIYFTISLAMSNIKIKKAASKKRSEARMYPRPSWHANWVSVWLSNRTFQIATMYAPRWLPGDEDCDKRRAATFWADFRLTKEGDLWLDHRVVRGPILLPCCSKRITAAEHAALDHRGKLLCAYCTTRHEYFQVLREDAVPFAEKPHELEGFALGGFVSTSTTLEG